MGVDDVAAESTVSGNQANIPAHIRHELGIDNGDRLRWQITDDGTLHVEVVRRGAGTFDGFDGYDGTETTDIRADRDAWAVD